MYRALHGITQCRINHLVLLHAGFAFKSGAHNGCLEVVAVALHRDLSRGDAFFYALFEFVCLHVSARNRLSEGESYYTNQNPNKTNQKPDPAETKPGHGRFPYSVALQGQHLFQRTDPRERQHLGWHIEKPDRLS